MQTVSKPIRLPNASLVGNTRGRCLYDIGNGRQLNLFLDNAPGDGIAKSQLAFFFLKGLLRTLPNNLIINDGLPTRLSSYADVLEGRFHIVRLTEKACSGLGNRPLKLTDPRFRQFAKEAESIRTAVQATIKKHVRERHLHAGLIQVELGLWGNDLVISNIFVSGFFTLDIKKVGFARAAEILTGQEAPFWRSAKAA